MFVKKSTTTRNICQDMGAFFPCFFLILRYCLLIAVVDGKIVTVVRKKDSLAEEF